MNDDLSLSPVRLVWPTVAVVTVSAGWMALCAARNWSPLGLAGIPLGLLAGTAFRWTDRSRGGLVAGAIAVTVVALAMVLGQRWSLGDQPRQDNSLAEGDAVFITALAEQILAEQGTRLAVKGEAPPEVLAGAPVLNSRTAIPERLWKLAEKRWHALPEAKKQEARQQQAAFAEQSGIKDNEPRRHDAPWGYRLGMIFVSNLLAFGFASIPNSTPEGSPNRVARLRYPARVAGAPASASKGRRVRSLSAR